MLSIYVAFPLAGVTWAVFLLERIVVDAKRISGLADVSRNHESE